MGRPEDDVSLWNGVYIEIARHAKDTTKMSELRASTVAIMGAIEAWNRRTAPPAAPPEPHPCRGYPTWEKPEYAIHCEGCSHPNARPQGGGAQTEGGDPVGVGRAPFGSPARATR